MNSMILDIVIKLIDQNSIVGELVIGNGEVVILMIE